MANEIKIDIDLGITRFEYGESDRLQRGVLTISTSKYYNGGLISDATVYWVGAHSRQNVTALHGNGGDYHKRLLVSVASLRGTQRNIDQQHAAVFTDDMVADLLRGAKEHYAGCVATGFDGYGNSYTTPSAVISNG